MNEFSMGGGLAAAGGVGVAVGSALAETDAHAAMFD
jgi:hypothetical protein